MAEEAARPLDDKRYRPAPRRWVYAKALGLLAVSMGLVGLALFLWDASTLPPALLCGISGGGLLVLCVLIPMLIRRIRARGRAIDLIRDNDDAKALLEVGRASAAADRWEGLCETARPLPWFHALLVHNLGTAWMMAGDLERGLGLMERARRSGWLDTRVLSAAKPQLDVARALGLVLAGDVEGAQRENARLRAELSPERAAGLALVEAIIAARLDRWDAVGVPEGDRRRAIEAVLGPIQRRGLDLLGAMAMEARGSRAEDVNAAVERAAVRPGELDFMAARWPALERFLRTRGLAGEGLEAQMRSGSR